MNMLNKIVLAVVVLCVALSSCDDKSKDPMNPEIHTPYKFTPGFVDNVEHPTSIDVIVLEEHVRIAQHSRKAGRQHQGVQTQHPRYPRRSHGHGFL